MKKAVAIVFCLLILPAISDARGGGGGRGWHSRATSGGTHHAAKMRSKKAKAHIHAS